MRINVLRAKLLHRIHRRYKTVTQDVEIGGLRFSFTRIEDPDRVLDEVAAEADLRDRLAGKQADGDQLHLPYWAELWDSAWGIGAYLVNYEFPTNRIPESNPNSEIRIEKSARLRGANILDLGCGMGMAGTVAAALGAHVTFADLEQPALLFAQLNSLPWRRRVRMHQLNWQRDRLPEKFDLILGADILYENVQWPFLNTFWREHLCEGGRVLLGEPGRQTGDLFIEWITAQKWRLERHEVPVSTHPKPIRIFLIS